MINILLKNKIKIINESKKVHYYNIFSKLRLERILLKKMLPMILSTGYRAYFLDWKINYVMNNSTSTIIFILNYWSITLAISIVA